MRCPGLELSGPCPIFCESFCCVIYLSSAHTPGAKHPCSEAESTAPIPGTSQPGFLHAYSHSSACYLCISYRALPRPPQISVVPTLSVIPHFRRGEKTLIVWHYMMLGHIELHCIMPQGLTGCMNESKHVCVLLSSRLAALYSLQGTKYLRRK